MKSKLSLLLVGMFLILLINFQTSSALTLNCCPETNSGAICQNLDSTDSASCKTSLLPIKCEDSLDCKIGCCFDLVEGLCTANSPKNKCESEGGEWDEDNTCLIQKCEKGCCALGTNTQFVTDTRCSFLSLQEGFEKDFDKSISESVCRHYSLEESACVLSGGNCIHTTEEDCVTNLGGTSYDSYCSDGGLKVYGVDCTAKDSVGCSGEENLYEVYNFDSCGNKEDVAESCDYPESKCAEGSCNDLSCIDENGKSRQNGESWCIYDAYVGESRDLIGSRHWRSMCVEGEIETEGCSDYRNQICAEKVIEGTSISQCRVNEGFKCFLISNTEECKVVPDCRVESVYVDKYFYFDACVPKYPLGFDFDSTDKKKNGKSICSLGSQTCTVYSQKDWKGKSSCVGNCECLTDKFTEEMNEFCISLGDCGNYINIEGANSKGNKTNDYTKYLTKENKENNTPLFIFSGLRDGSYSDTLSLFNDAGGFEFGEIYDGSTKGNFRGITFAYHQLKYALTGIPDIGDITFLAGDYLADEVGFLGNMRTAIIEWIYGDGDTRTISFDCVPWKPPVGGKGCEECNKDPLKPCTQYKCSSLGRSCGLINKDFENPLCFNKYPYDVSPPVISLGEVFTEDYDFVNGEAKKVEIKKNNGECVQEYTKINFSLNTNEYSTCKFNYKKTNWITYDSEGEYSEESTEFTRNHTFEIRVPYLSHPDVNSDELNMYIRCQDPAGNLNVEEYMVKLCLKSGPDLLAPRIIKTTPISGSFLKYGITESFLEVYLDGPAQCKYGVVGKKQYADMSNDFLICDSAEQIRLEYSCLTLLTGLTETENKIYIKCNDTSGNINAEDFVYTLQATENELEIDSITPQGTLESGFEPISVELEVKTSKGAEDGKSKCSWEWGGSWVQFLNTFSTTHTQPGLSLMGGNFNISIKCKDIAGNIANGNAVFNLEVDSVAPIAVRVFYEGGNLKLITNEKAKCYYDSNSCEFNLEDGTSMTSLFSTEHTANWIVGETYYIKCKDIWNNENPTCAIKAEPS